MAVAKGVETKAEPTNAVGIQSLPTAKIAADPKTFQFRAKVDESGTDNRLDGVDKWDEMRAGVLTVYERKDGSHVVADGHNRLEMAKRLGVPNVNAFVVKESDGYTPADVKGIAGLANLAQGTGSALDAAKLFRSLKESPEAIIQAHNLPPNSAPIRQGINLAKLSLTCSIWSRRAR